MVRKRGTQHLRRRRRGRTTEPLPPPVDVDPLSVRLERAAERSRRRWRGWEINTWGDHRTTSWERRSRLAWFVRSWELGGVARRQLIRQCLTVVAVVVGLIVVAGWIS